MASFLHNTNIGVPIIDSIPHCHTENAFKRGKNQEMWLLCYIEDKVGVCIIDIIPHCFSKHFSKAVWNTIQLCPLYSKEAIFLDFCLFSKHIQYGSVEYYIDDRFSNFVLPLYRNEVKFLIFASFERVFSMPVWNTIDDTYSNFVFYIVTKPSSI